jgi:hypothetical protein
MRREQQNRLALRFLQLKRRRRTLGMRESICKQKCCGGEKPAVKRGEHTLILVRSQPVLATT